MKKIRSKCVCFFQSVNINIVFRHSRVANSRQPAMESGQNLNSSKFLWMSSLHARMKKTKTKFEGARVLTVFLSFAQGQLTQHSPSNKAKFRTHLRFMVTIVKKGAICCRHMATRVLILFGP